MFASTPSVASRLLLSPPNLTRLFPLLLLFKKLRNLTRYPQLRSEPPSRSPLPRRRYPSLSTSLPVHRNSHSSPTSSPRSGGRERSSPGRDRLRSSIQSKPTLEGQDRSSRGSRDRVGVRVREGDGSQLQTSSRQLHQVPRSISQPSGEERQARCWVRRSSSICLQTEPRIRKLTFHSFSPVSPDAFSSPSSSSSSRSIEQACSSIGSNPSSRSLRRSLLEEISFRRRRRRWQRLDYSGRSSTTRSCSRRSRPNSSLSSENRILGSRHKLTAL